MKIDITGKCIKCVKCGEHANINHIINNRGFGSLFDSITEPTAIPVCSKCNSKHLRDEWFDEEPVINGWCEYYKHEDEIMSFINSLDKHISDKIINGEYA